jgi:uncharacterized protein (TIGR01777 family)
MKIMISGSHGLIGTALKARLEEDGHIILRLSRNFTDGLSFKDIDAVIHLAGENIAAGRWNEAKKRRIKESRVGPTKQLSELMAGSPDKPSVFISASAIGYYGNRGSDVITEDAEPGEGYLSSVCAQWEASTRLASVAGIRTVNLRTGIVLSKKGGALKQMLTPFRLGAGGPLGDGKQFMSWISLADAVEAISYLITNPAITGPVNLTAPNPVNNHDFSASLGKALHRPAFLPMPAFAARILFGEMAEALLLSSARVIPDKLIQSGFAFKHTDLASALEDILSE